MPLDYAVGILDYRLIWNDAVAPAAAAAVESETVAAAATVVAAAAEEVGQEAPPSCFSELDEEAPSAAAPAQTPAQTQAQAQDACLLHPEFRKMEIGISAIANKALEPSLAFLKSAIGKLKKRMTDPKAGEELCEAKDGAVDVFSTSFDADDKLQAIKVALVSQILIFLNTPVEDFGLQEKLRAIQSTRRSCLLFLKKLNQLRAVRQSILKKLKEEDVETPEQQQQEQQQEQQQGQQQQEPTSDAESIRLNEVFAMNLQTCAFLRLIHQKVLQDVVGEGGVDGGDGGVDGGEGGRGVGATGRDKSQAAIVAEIVGGAGAETAPEIRLEEGHESIFAVMGRVYRRTKDEDLRTLLEFEVEELVDCFCATADDAYWLMASQACDAIDVSIRRKALKKVQATLEELLERLLEMGEMHFLRRMLKIVQTTGFSPPMEKDALTQIQKIINRKLDLFDEIKDVQLLKDIAALVSATGFSQLLEACRRECGAVAKAADAALCRCSSKSAPDLDAANAFNEKSCYPWISAKASQRLAAAAEATPPSVGAADEWLQRSFDAPKTICFVAMKAPSMQECAPTAFALLGCADDAVAAADDTLRDEAQGWTRVMEASTAGWKGGDWKAFAVDRLAAFKHWRVHFTANGKGEKVSLKNLKLFL